LLSVLAHFFEPGRWGSPADTVVESQSLTAEDQFFVLTQAGMYLTATRGFPAPEARICYESAARLCRSLKRPVLLYLALMGQWRYSLMTDTLTATMQVSKRLYSLAQEQNDSALMIGAYRALACTLYYLGDFEAARRYAMLGVQIWRSGNVQSPVEEVTSPAVSCLISESLSEWHVGEIIACQATMAEAISLAKELNDTNALAVALQWAAILNLFERDAAKAERSASDLIELATRHRFQFWLATGTILCGWARSVSGETAEGISWMERGIRDFRANGSTLAIPFFLGLKAEALYLANRTSEALEGIREAKGRIERYDERWWSAELHRLEGVFLAALGADEMQTEASFRAAISTATKQKSVSLEKRAEATYEEYLRQKASGSGERGFRLPLW
jgi:hypothetical protein